MKIRSDFSSNGEYFRKFTEKTQMSKFIDKIAQHIVEKNLPLANLVIVLPSERARKYLQSALFKAYKKPIFSPKIITMNRWAHELSPVPVIDTTRALFKLYDTHLAVDKEETQTFDEFLKWGRILLSDFDEIDRYLIDSKDLFKNLSDIKDIENWSFSEPEELTEGQKKYMRFWELLQDYYVHFNQRLEKDGECYMGKVYRNIANHIDIVFEKDKKAHFIFAGFNAVSPAETSIIKQLYTMGKAEVFIDADEFYLHNKNHEAGAFIRDLLSKLKVKSLPFIIDKLKKEPKEIQIINCAQVTGQAKVSGTILDTEIKPEELSETLVLLGDESLVVPVIKNIPRSVLNANITLGLPLKNTSVKSWVDLMFAVQEHHYQFKNNQIYHKDFIRFIKHPFITGYCNEKEKISIAKIESEILKNNWVFIYYKKLNLEPRILKLVTLFFAPWTIKADDYPLNHIRTINEVIRSGLENEKNAIERSVLYYFDRSLIKLQNVLEEFKPSINLGTFKVLFNQHWINESVAYYGNPLDGIQVMGLLETRLLDFKNMIVVGLNDGSMPPTNPIQSMIMMDLRRYFNLPTPREKQGLFAHHFYRLLHHAERCWITYSSANSESGGMGEPSRYILQLELELARANPNLKIQKKDYTITNEEEQSGVTQIEKTETILKRLDSYFSTQTSVSALKTYLRCSLDFYYKYLLGLGQEEKVEEEVEASTFGSIIHDTLEELYLPFALLDKENKTKEKQHKTVGAADVALMLKNQNKVLESHFKKRFQYDETPIGRNYLGLEMANHLTRSFLRKELTDLKEKEGHFYVIGLEMELQKKLTLQVNGVEKHLNFRGIVDRVDEWNGEKRILDYKSGKCSESDVKITKAKKNATEEEKIQKLVSLLRGQNHIFQLLVYNMLFYDKFKYYPDKVGIISMINLQDSPYFLKNELTDTTESLMELFEKALSYIVAEIYDTEKPFEHSGSGMFNFCDYCEV